MLREFKAFLIKQNVLALAVDEGVSLLPHDDRCRGEPVSALHERIGSYGGSVMWRG